jgi:GT2 family glycosyltransferase
MCVGGAVVPVYETPLPVWFPEDLESIFKPQIHDAVLHQVFYPHYPYGANFSIRAEAVRQIGEFNTSLGYKGNNLMPCEETEFMLRVEKAGFKVLIEPRAVVNHIIPANRLTHHYLRHRQYAYGQARAFMDYLHYSSVASKFATINMMIKLTSLVIKNVKLRTRFWTWLPFYGHTIHSCTFLHLCRLSAKLGYSDQELKILTKQLFLKTRFVSEK